MECTETKTLLLNVADLQPNEGQLESIGVHANPRQISEADYAKLVSSLREKNLTGVLPLKVYQHQGAWIVLGGNMRLRAMQEIGIEKVSCIVVPGDMDAESLNEIIIKDNSTFGTWDMDALANEWDADKLAAWGVDTPLGAGILDENGNYQAEDVTEFEQAQILHPEDEYIIITCSPDEFDDMREHFGCGYIRPLEAGKKYADKKERARVVKWRDYVDSNTK